jgi:membrane-associated protein
MSYGRFVTYNVLGGLLWTALFVFGGYYFGNQPLVKRNFTLVILAIIVLSLLPLVVEFVQNYRRKARASRTQPSSEKVT